jgi:hypothetical protein
MAKAKAKATDYLQIGIRVPTVHLNGSNGPALAAQVGDAAHAVHAAIEALHGTAPHGRDYYLQGEGAYQQAREQHEDRVARLRSVHAELAAIYERLAAIYEGQV